MYYEAALTILSSVVTGTAKEDHEAVAIAQKHCKDRGIPIPDSAPLVISRVYANETQVAYAGPIGSYLIQTGSDESVRPMPLQFYADPGHGWLRVSEPLLNNIGVAPGDISSFSYRQGGYVYLEEDCDAPVAMKQFKAAGIEVKLTVRRTDSQSSIRKMPRHIPSQPWSMKQPGVVMA